MSKMTIGPNTFVNVGVKPPGIGKFGAVTSHDQGIGEFEGQDFYSNQFPFRQAHGLAPFGFPLSLFQNGEQGAWYDPSDMSSMFQDANGFTAAVVGQPVGLILDKSKGLVLGPELVPNGKFVADVSGWQGNNANAIFTWNAPDSATFTNIADFAFERLNPAPVLPAGSYLVQYDILALINPMGGSLHVGMGTNGHTPVLGHNTQVFTSAGGANEFQIRPNNAGAVSVTISNVSIKALPGNHASQAVAANRPTLLQDSSGLNFLFFDGVNDSLSTGNIDFTGTDKMSVFVGLQKSSDAAPGLIVELSPTALVNNGSFNLSGPDNAGVHDFGFVSRGSTNFSSVLANNEVAPITAVVTGLADIAVPSTTIRVNGVQAAASGSVQGASTYGNYQLFIGIRNAVSFPFNGRIYSTVIRGALSSAQKISETETYVGGMTGIAL